MLVMALLECIMIFIVYYFTKRWNGSLKVISILKSYGKCGDCTRGHGWTWNFGLETSRLWNWTWNLKVWWPFSSLAILRYRPIDTDISIWLLLGQELHDIYHLNLTHPQIYLLFLIFGTPLNVFEPILSTVLTCARCFASHLMTGCE